ncbi:MAG: hypothetical protein CL927_19770 [Deltaproteobacteria bacterium]|nr:hypothetical protein [Deltaproteobacteria bacterium]HCH66629.1 hypothetical protein [Deltaproteobacteria bacterium]
MIHDRKRFLMLQGRPTAPRRPTFSRLGKPVRQALLCATMILGGTACGTDSGGAGNFIRCSIDGQPFDGDATGYEEYGDVVLSATGTLRSEDVTVWVGLGNPSTGSRLEGPSPGEITGVRVTPESGEALEFSSSHSDLDDDVRIVVRVDDYKDDVISGTFSAVLANADGSSRMTVEEGEFEVQLDAKGDE